MPTRSKRIFHYGIVTIMSINHRAFLFLLSFCAALAVMGATATAQSPHKAAPLRLMMPAACTPGQSCWVVNHVDMNPASGMAEDFTCGSKTYDGHEGTDFGLLDTAAMKGGVSVLAAAPGRVMRVRNNLQDANPTPEQIEKMLAANQGCGNGVLIDHGKGWQSIYCHLKAGSVLVQPDMQVTAGQKIADIGQSGAAEFPHLHFGLFYEEKPGIVETVDPFSGTYAAQGCGHAKGAMWDVGMNIDYDPMAIYASGFATGVPDFNKLRENASSPATLTPAIEALTYWVGLYGMHEGDQITLSITAPDGTTFATQTLTQERDRARQFYYVGRKIGDPLLPGEYRGMAVIRRAIAGSDTEALTRTSEKILTISNPLHDSQQTSSDGVLLP